MPVPDIDALGRSLDERLAAFDTAGAMRLVRDAVGSGALDIPTLYDHVLIPFLVELGERWHAGDVTVWQEHLASSAVRTIVDSLYPRVAELAAAAPVTGRSALLACPPKEPHDVGLRMLADRFELAGWRAYFLGADVPEGEIVAAAEGLRPDLVVLSASTHFNRLELRDVVDRVRPSLGGARLLVTGHAFALTHEGWSEDEVLDLDALLGAG